MICWREKCQSHVGSIAWEVRGYIFLRLALTLTVHFILTSKVSISKSGRRHIGLHAMYWNAVSSQHTGSVPRLTWRFLYTWRLSTHPRSVDVASEQSSIIFTHKPARDLDKKNDHSWQPGWTKIKSINEEKVFKTVENAQECNTVISFDAVSAARRTLVISQSAFKMARLRFNIYQKTFKGFFQTWPEHTDQWGGILYFMWCLISSLLTYRQVDGFLCCMLLLND